MKKQTLFRIAITILFLVSGKLSASAQSSEYMMTFQVPFDFQVNEKVLPAGKYTFKRVPETPYILQIKSVERNVWLYVQTIPHSLTQQPARTNLIFKMYGEKRFLSEVNVVGLENGFAMIRSKTERRLAKIAKTNTIADVQQTQEIPTDDNSTN